MLTPAGGAHSKGNLQRRPHFFSPPSRDPRNNPFPDHVSSPWVLQSRWSRFSVVVGLWTIFGLYSAVQSHFRSSFGPHPLTWGRALLGDMSYGYLWAAATPLIAKLCRRHPLHGASVGRSIGVHVAAMLVIASGVKLLWDALLAPQYSFYRSGVSPLAILRSLDLGLEGGVLLYWIVVLVSTVTQYYEQYQQGLLRASQLQEQLAQSQLQALKMQLHPHFLFNTLNTISGLVHDDAEAAERMIVRLSHLLRASLDMVGVQEVPLNQEIRLLNLYLDIERLRYDDRLIVDFQIEPDTLDAVVPNLILQPIVENSIRHGISQRIAGGHVHISARREDGSLLLSVRDNGPGLAQWDGRPVSEGVGLSTTRARLSQLYGAHQSLVLASLGGEGLEVRITMPFQTGSREVTRGDHQRHHRG